MKAIVINIVQLIFSVGAVICMLIFGGCIEIIKYKYFVKTKEWEKFVIEWKYKKRMILSFMGATLGLGIAWYIGKLI